MVRHRPAALPTRALGRCALLLTRAPLAPRARYQPIEKFNGWVKHEATKDPSYAVDPKRAIYDACNKATPRMCQGWIDYTLPCV